MPKSMFWPTGANAILRLWQSIFETLAIHFYVCLRLGDNLACWGHVWASFGFIFFNRSVFSRMFQTEYSFLIKVTKAMQFDGMYILNITGSRKRVASWAQPRF